MKCVPFLAACNIIIRIKRYVKNFNDNRTKVTCNEIVSELDVPVERKIVDKWLLKQDYKNVIRYTLISKLLMAYLKKINKKQKIKLQTVFDCNIVMFLSHKRSNL